MAPTRVTIGKPSSLCPRQQRRGDGRRRALCEPEQGCGLAVRYAKAKSVGVLSKSDEPVPSKLQCLLSSHENRAAVCHYEVSRILGLQVRADDNTVGTYLTDAVADALCNPHTHPG
jgi:hypothetical protein